MKTQKLKHYHLATWLLAFSFLLTTGMKCKKDGNLTGKNQLPPITQEGKNTFGFLLNGEVWTPKAPILRSKLDLSYDPTYNGGALGISANQLISNEDKKFLHIGMTNVNKTGTYYFNDNARYVIYTDIEKKLDYYENTKITGSITITKLDLTGHGVISGTFEFKLEKEGCPTINATEGRFDMSIE